MEVTNHFALRCILALLIALFSSAAYSMDICGDGTCGPTEDLYWCSKDCDGLCGDTFCSRDEATPQCSECPCVDTVEEDLARLINEYRVSMGLSSIPLGRKISIVALAHARDSSLSRLNDSSCNIHSWSSETFDNLSFKGCCYTGDFASEQCMSDKPREIVGLSQDGFEISVEGNNTATEALTFLRGYPETKPILSNENEYEDIIWTFMGVGYDEWQKIFHVWFYPGTDDEIKRRVCDPTNPLPYISPSPSTSEFASTSPTLPSSTTPSASASASPYMLSTYPEAPHNNALQCPGLFRVGIVERAKVDNTIIDKRMLWEGNLHAINPTEPIPLPVLTQSWFTAKSTKAMLWFEVCGGQAVIIRYYKGLKRKTRRRKRKLPDRATGLAYDDFERSIKKVFGKRHRYFKWSQSSLRVQIWLGDGRKSTPPSVTFRLHVSQ